MRLPVNTVIHTTLVGLEPATFRPLVRRATSSATEPIQYLQWNAKMWYSYKEKFLSSLLLDPDPPSIPPYWFPQTSGVWWMWHSYHVDNAESTESVLGRLKTCVYHEETASTCSVSGLSWSTLQPMKLGRARSRDVTDSTAHTRHSTPKSSARTHHRTPSSSGGTKPR